MSRIDAPLLLLVAGGTGGHIYPALAVALELQDRGLRIAWIGTNRGLEIQVASEAKIPFYGLPVMGLRGKSLSKRIFAGLMIFVSLFQAIYLIKKLKPSCVLGMGGYVSVPGVIAGWLLRKPLLIQEQNAIAGTANRFLAPFANVVISGFSNAFKNIKNVKVLGNPVRKKFLELSDSTPFCYEQDRKLRILIVGGSLGAKKINEMVIGAVSQLDKEVLEGKLEFWHQCGKEHVDTVSQAYQDLDDKKIRVSPYIEDMAEAYAWADLVLSRSGALTISELAIMGRPALLVPLPNAIDDHQRINSYVLAECGAAKIINQKDLSSLKLRNLFLDFISQPAALKKMAQSALTVAKPNATRDICKLCMEYIDHG